MKSVVKIGIVTGQLISVILLFTGQFEALIFWVIVFGVPLMIWKGRL